MIFYGILLLAFSIGSWLLPRYAGVQFFVMSWVDNWGITAGIIIRCVIGLIGVGMVVKGMADHRRAR